MLEAPYAKTKDTLVLGGLAGNFLLSRQFNAGLFKTLKEKASRDPSADKQP